MAATRGSLVVADDYDAYLLVGDETALPAIARRLEEMPPRARVFSVIEVEDHREERRFRTAADAHITWLHREGAPAASSSLLETAVKSIPVGRGDVYAWVACEIEVARRLRKLLIDEWGLPRSQIKAAGYWREGEAGAHSKIED